MSRWVPFWLCAISGLMLLVIGFQVPAHLRAVDEITLLQAGQGTPTLIDAGIALAKAEELGPAQLFSAAADSAWLKGHEKLHAAVDELAGKNPSASRSNPSPSFTEFIVRAEQRAKALELLQTSSSPVVRALLHFRTLTNTALFPPASSSSGQAIDTAISITGLLITEGHISAAFQKEIQNLATQADRDPLLGEQVLMDLMSLGQRFNWGQLTLLVTHINDANTLSVLADRVKRGNNIPVLYASIGLTKDAAGVAKYLTTFSETGPNDLRLGLEYHAGGVKELLGRNQRLCSSKACAHITSLAKSGGFLPIISAITPTNFRFALALKWGLYLAGGFLLAAALHYIRRITPLEKPLEVRGFHFVREFLFALGFLLVVLLGSEPFLASGNQKTSPPFRLHLPVVGDAAPAGNNIITKTFMNSGILLTLLLFFVLQGLIYIACLVKLAEIRKQRVPPRIKLKLLENEEHLFDAGLYLGFVGTIVSLILVSLNVIHFSLMAAYSCTCFGIVFVVIFKIFHLRSARRQLLLEAESESPGAATPTSTYAASV